MKQKTFDFSLLLFIFITSFLMAVLMQSVITLFFYDIYNPNYYLYQALLYCSAGFIIIKNRREIRTGRYIRLFWAFSILCFFLSFIRLDVINARSIIALFFNTFIIPLAFLNGIWLGGRLSFLKDRDWYLLLLQIPALYSMFQLLSYISYGNWYDPDAAFCIIVFFPLLFLFKRNWIIILLTFLYVVFTLNSAKRSIFIFVAISLVIYFIYLLLFNSNRNVRSFINKLLAIIILVGGLFFVVASEDSGLSHMQERAEMRGGMTYDSDREELYGNISSAVLNSDFVRLFCGHGHMAVKRDFNFGAHNDILEIAYDYGIIASALYFFILLWFIRMVLSNFHNKHYESAMRLGIGISSIIILGMLNCIVTNTFLEYSMFLTLGCVIGTKDDNSIQQ